MNFYPRPPRGGRHAPLFLQPKGSRHFYPRPPRGGRRGCAGTGRPSADFYPRPPRGGRPKWIADNPDAYKFLSTPSARRATGYFPQSVGQFLISIHALREEGDTPESDKIYVILSISIHALREEGDLFYMQGEGVLLDFYPRPPRGGRQQKQRQNLYFQTNYTTFCTNLEEP